MPVSAGYEKLIVGSGLADMEAVRLLDIPGIETNEILFVGDNPYTDIIGAHGVGMKTAWIRMGRDSPGDAPHPDFIVDHVEELKVHLA